MDDTRTPLRILAGGCIGLGLLAGVADAAGVRTITVAKDGSAQFTSIQAAVDSVTDATADSPVDILIKGGVYAGEMVTTKNWVNLVGENRDACILRYTRKPEEPTHKTHVIWATSSSTIRNLTLIGGDVKYCIHSDGGGPYVLTVDNCLLRREIDGKPVGMGFGIGLHADQHIILQGSRVQAVRAVYFHNWNSQRKPCSMTIENCVLTGVSNAIFISTLGSRQRDFFVVHDSVLEGGEDLIVYRNTRNVKSRPDWYGNNEIELIGSGNTLSGTAAGAEMADDSGQRLSGLELARRVKARHPLADGPFQEDYGTGGGKLPNAGAWRPAPPGSKYHLEAQVTDDALVLSRPAGAGGFGTAGGPMGAMVGLPLVAELRLKCTPAPRGKVILYYCVAPHSWRIEWQPDKVLDSYARKPAIPVDTTQWQTYRLVARSPEDVRLFVDGLAGDGIPLSSAKHTAAYFQLRLYGAGSKAEIDKIKLSTESL